MSLTAILAVSDDGIIGLGNAIPWKLKPDMQRFKAKTIGRAIIMGRKTFESIGRVLPERHSIVITRRPVLPPLEVPALTGTSLSRVDSPEAAIAAAAEAPGRGHAFVIGGAQVYAALWPRVTRVELTEVHVTVGAGTPLGFEIRPDEWQETERVAGEHDGLKFHFVTLERAGQ